MITGKYFHTLKNIYLVLISNVICKEFNTFNIQLLVTYYDNLYLDITTYHTTTSKLISCFDLKVKLLILVAVVMCRIFISVSAYPILVLRLISPRLCQITVPSDY